MPVHDWNRVEAGIFHAFHTAWIGVLQTRLNDGVLPSDFYALAEQNAGDIVPDVLTLHASADENGEPFAPAGIDDGGVAVAEHPPRTRLILDLPDDSYTLRRRRLMIRHVSHDRVVAIIEIVSPGNKSSREALSSFTDKVLDGLRQGIHFLVIDLQPPTSRDPDGIHGVIGEALGGTYTAPKDKPLTLAAYVGRPRRKAYIEPVAVGDPLMAMPLFLTIDNYIEVPLESTYTDAFRGVPSVYKRILEG